MATSSSPARTKPTVAVAGATGDLGLRLITAFRSPVLRNKLSGIVALARKPSEKTDEWKAQGAEIRTISQTSTPDEMIEALEGVDVLVNAISTSGAALRDALVEVLPKTSVKLYFPSEFGVDHTLHDFGIPEWDSKKAHFELAKQHLRTTQIQICRLFVGLFLHSGIGPDYGFDTANGVYEIAGDVDGVVSYTDIGDNAWVITILSSGALCGEAVPETLRLAGTHASIREVREIMIQAGAGDVELKSLNLEDFKKNALSRKYEDRDAIECLRFIMGDGRDDYRPVTEGGLGNDNEVVNPGQRYFSWETVQGLAMENRGKPNSGNR